jgi:hypothetical protein
MAMAQPEEPQVDAAATLRAKLKGRMTRARGSGFGQKPSLESALLQPPPRTRNLALTSPPRGRA